MSEIPDIDAWNALLNPANYEDSNPDDSVFPGLGTCGCCPIPKCCPPQLECRSLQSEAQFEGFNKPEDSVSESTDDVGTRVTLWLKQIQTTTSTSSGDTISTYPAGGTNGGTDYVSASESGTVVRTYTQEYDQSFSATIGGTGGTCKQIDAVFTDACAGGGSWTESIFAAYFADDTWSNYKSSETVHTVSHIGGTPDPESSTGALYPECTYKEVRTQTRWERVDGVVQLVPDTPEDPNPSTIEIIPASGPSGGTTVETTYENPKTYLEALTDAESWINANIEMQFTKSDGSNESDSDYCDTNNSCVTSKRLFDSAAITHLIHTMVQYRWKLNICCGTYTALSWLEVAFSKAFLDWLAGDTSDEPPDTPAAVTKGWVWNGTELPSRCDTSDSTEFTEEERYEDESTWSPWSATMKYDDGDFEGSKRIRSLYMLCHRSIYGQKPDLIIIPNAGPFIPEFNPSDLDEDG